MVAIAAIDPDTSPAKAPSPALAPVLALALTLCSPVALPLSPHWPWILPSSGRWRPASAAAPLHIAAANLPRAGRRRGCAGFDAQGGAVRSGRGGRRRRRRWRRRRWWRRLCRRRRRRRRTRRQRERARSGGGSGGRGRGLHGRPRRRARRSAAPVWRAATQPAAAAARVPREPAGLLQTAPPRLCRSRAVGAPSSRCQA